MCAFRLDPWDARTGDEVPTAIQGSLVSIGRFTIVKVLSLFPVALYGTQT